MAKNTGTLVTSAIRPNDSLDLIASAFGNEIKGGHHSYETIAERNSIIEERREWGMLCTVYNDGISNGTYKLVYNLYDTTITNNNNWQLFTGGGSEISAEWIPSVIDLVYSVPASPNDGEYYLIGFPSYGSFATQSGKVAKWVQSLNGGLGDWVYITPENGSTLRIDSNKNVLYKYEGTWSSGNWFQEYLTQIRYIEPTSLNGTTYSFTSSNNVSLNTYSYSIYYANFGYTNSGPSELQIDGLGYYPIRKVSSNSKLDLAAEDLVPGIQYQLAWNSGEFQIQSFGGGASAGVIGDAEDGNYSDGLFTDFTPSTPIGIPIDRFNEILKSLVPPSAPNLQSWSLTGPTFVNGKLSFDSINAGAFGLTAVPNTNVGDTYSASGFTLGINSLYNQPKTGTTNYSDITGIINYTVDKGPGDPTPAYATYSFGNGMTGSLVLILNGTTVSSVDLSSTTSSINTTLSGATSGFVLSAATSSRYSSGAAFDIFWNRTGTYLIKRDDPRLRPGYNYLELQHILVSGNLQTGTYSWVSDSATSSTSFSNAQLTINSANPRFLSGIRFFTTVSIDYSVDLQNHVRNTYNFNNALSASVIIPSPTTHPNGINSKITTTSQPVMTTPNPKTISNPSSPSTLQNISWSFTLNPNVRRMNEGFSFSTSVFRTVQGQDTSSYLSRNNWFIDNYTTDPTNTNENFIKETFRLQNGFTKNATLNDVITSWSVWDNQSSLFSDAAHNNGLQVLNGQLVYPNFNYSSPGDALTNPNFGLPNINYTLCNLLTTGLPLVFAQPTTFGGPQTNYRTYTRYFYLGNSNFTNMRFNIVWDSTNFVSSTSALSGNNCWIEAKLPRDTTATSALVNNAVTGWMDMTKPYLPSENWLDGSGSLKGTRPTSSNGNWEVTFGTRGTVLSGGYILLRITAPSTWTGHISQIQCIGIAG